MIKTQIPGKIYPLEMQTCTESSLLKVYSIPLNSGAGSGIENFPLLEFNNESLAPGHGIVLEADRAKTMFLISFRDTIRYNDLSGRSHLIKPGMLFANDLSKGERIRISNMNENGFCNYLRICTLSSEVFPISAQISFFNLTGDTNPNKLLEIFSTGHPALSCSFKKISIGKFTGRQDVLYMPQDKVNMKQLLYLAKGEMEACGRLLHAGDGLLLRNANAISMEALSHEAQLLLIELC